MRKTLLSAIVASAFAVSGSAIAAPLSFDLNGSAPGNQITASSLDWAQTSFLALGGALAISNKVSNDMFGTALSTTFDVLTHAKLTGYNDGAGVTRSLPGSFTGEITVVSRFTENVTFADPAAAFARFKTTGVGWVEMYYSATPNSSNLTGSNFNDGTLIMRAEGVGLTNGNFTVDDPTAVDMDGFGTQDYSGQKTVSGLGSQGAIRFGTGGIALDSSFLQTAIVDFSLFFNNISIGLPFQTVDPSDCFNPNQSAATNANINAGTATGLATQCLGNHVNGLYSANATDGGYLPVVGATNGLFGSGAPDFVAQTDFNSAVTGTVPEPGMLALLGLAFAGLGVTTMRRRRA
jgi:hypothetical protein